MSKWVQDILEIGGFVVISFVLIGVTGKWVGKKDKDAS